MESLVERPQVQLMRAVKKTLRMERRAETRSWFVAVLVVSFYLFLFVFFPSTGVGWTYDQEGEGEFVSVGVEMVDKHCQDDADD